MKIRSLLAIAVLALLAGCGETVTQPVDSALSFSPYAGRSAPLNKYNIQFDTRIPELDVEAAVLAAIAVPQVKALPAEANYVNVYAMGQDRLEVTVGQWGNALAVSLAKSNGVWQAVEVSPLVE